MWNLIMKAREQADRAHIITIPESEEEWEAFIHPTNEDDEYFVYKKQSLQEQKPYLLTFLPQLFHRFIEEGTFYSQELTKRIRDKYLSWQLEQQQKFHEVLDAAYANKMATCTHLNELSKAIFSESLHDFRIINVDRGENQVKLVFDTSGGFSIKSYVALTLTSIISESGHVQIGQNYAYDELIKTDKGISWRVLFDCPEEEWTIEAEQFDAEFYYYPKTREQFSSAGDFNGYVNSLNRDYQYTWISSHLKSAIVSLQPFELLAGSLVKSEKGVFVGDIFIANTLEECFDFIHTDTYEDPYVHFSEAVDDADLLAFAMSDDMEKTVRAWNTMYAEPVRLQATINTILLAINPPDIDDMMQYVYVRHFEKEGVLNAEVRLKFAHCFDY